MGSNGVILERNIDFAKIEKMLKEKEMTNKDLAVAMGRGRNMLSTWKKNGGIPKVSIPLLCNVLRCDEADIMKSEQKEESPRYDTYIISELGEIKGDLKLLMANFLNMHEDLRAIREAIIPDLLTSKDKAVILLKQMMGDTGRCDEQDYVKKCNEIGIDSHSRKYAVEKLDCLAQSLGYGHNAKRIIFKRAREHD